MYYPASPARRVAYLLDMPRQPDESCGLAIVVSFFRIGSSRAISAHVTWGAWFGLVIGILVFRVLLWFGSTWDVPDLELIIGDPNRHKRGHCHSLLFDAANLRYLRKQQSTGREGKQKVSFSRLVTGFPSSPSSNAFFFFFWFSFRSWLQWTVSRRSWRPRLRPTRGRAGIHGGWNRGGRSYCGLSEHWFSPWLTSALSFFLLHLPRRDFDVGDGC